MEAWPHGCADHLHVQRAVRRQLGFTRTRVNQLMDLLLLAPEVQKEILFLELPPGAQPGSERGA